MAVSFARHVSVVLACLLLLLTACAPGGGSTQPPRSQPPATSDANLTPLVITALAPDPVPVRGSDGRIHVSYELDVLNTAPKDASLTRVDTVSEDGSTVPAGVDFAAHPFVDQAGGLPSAHGDRTRNENYLAYDQPLLAVADATVVAVVSDMPDAPPQTTLPGLTVPQLGGNHVTLQLDPARCAFYAYMKPGSAIVKIGDRVRQGQEIGRVGNSGNTSEPHLHFHVMNSPQPLTAVNLPFQIDRFELQGTVDQNGLVAGSPRGQRVDELPLIARAAAFGTSG